MLAAETERKTDGRKFGAGDGQESPPSRKAAEALLESVRSIGDTMSTASRSSPKSIADPVAGQWPSARKIWQQQLIVNRNVTSNSVAEHSGPRTPSLPGFRLT